MNKDILIQFVRQLLPMSHDRAAEVLEKFHPDKIAKNGYLLKAGKFAMNPISLRAASYDPVHLIWTATK
jgi:hypothetical protein